MYIEDFCKIIFKISQKLNHSSIINVASGKNITIRDIIKKLEKITKNPKIIFDLSKPQMIKFRKISVIKMRKIIGTIKLTNFEDGLNKTINWYKNDYKVRHHLECRFLVVVLIFHNGIIIMVDAC